MSNASFFDGGKYVRDYVLAILLGMKKEVMHNSPEGVDDPRYQAYSNVYDKIVDKFDDLFTEFKG